MAGSCARRSPRQNPRPAGKNELAGAAPTENSGTPIPTLIRLYAPTPAPATAPAVALSLNNELFKQFLKAYLEAQVPAQITPEIEPEPCE